MLKAKVLAMKKLVLIATLIVGSALTTACESTIIGEYVQKGKSSLRLFEESTGSLFDLGNGKMSIELDSASINPLEQNIVLRLKSSGNSFLIRIDKSKISEDGKFELTESELEQPIRISGQMKEHLEIKIFKGFSSSDEPIGVFSTKLENEVLKNSLRVKQAAL